MVQTGGLLIERDIHTLRHRLASGGIADRRGGTKFRSAKSRLRVSLGAQSFVELFECRDISGFDFRGS